ncbi:Golgi-associated plant pathogenesis-related protein 1 [Orchesella cincta]|uniref:Golgi-associated plant pathogenesis-related protein 1 n=1 Tax=Orchesella cincta TaxID=48709 RepID=A0A1D2M7R4_ORCCI|nr:Golgi-associated plant pathogenesis-related protein 1 [Orchesella cincta]
MVKDKQALWKVAVEEHNKYRRRHGVPDLKGDDEKIHSVAQRYAEYLASNDRFQHSSGTGYGENLAGAQGNDEVAAIRSAVKMWYDEISSYNYGYPGFSMATGHFTAVIWKSTTHLGIGVAYNSRKRWWVVVGNYNPPGNMQGSFPQNVPRLLPADEIKRIEKERQVAEEKNEGRKELEEESTPNTTQDEEVEVLKKSSGDKKVETVKARKLPNELWQLAVDEHNKYRRRHGAPKLKGDDEKIHKAAQNHASYLSQFNGLVHANNGYAESLAAVQAKMRRMH